MKTSLHAIVMNRWTAAALLACTFCLAGCHHEGGDDDRRGSLDQQRTSETAMNIVTTHSAMTAVLAIDA